MSKKISLRYQIGDLDLISGLIFLSGIFLMTYNVIFGLIIIGIAILKQFSKK